MDNQILRIMLKIQKEYNDKIRAEDPYRYDGKDEWAQVYLLGLVSEVNDVLEALNWKRHRSKNIAPDRTNLGLDLIDLLKYVLSLCELFEFSSHELYEFFIQKSEVLEIKRTQEMESIPTDRPILITDLDGTLADWRVAFCDWLITNGIDPQIDSECSMLIDHDIQMDYPTYYRLKETFESEGGYRNLSIYSDVLPFMEELRKQYDPYIIAVTARPNERYSRIWLDTWTWIVKHGLHVDKLLIGSSKRILLATTISSPVLMLEDDPSLLMRIGGTKIPTLARKHSYNAGIEFPSIQFFDNLSEISIDSLYKE